MKILPCLAPIFIALTCPLPAAIVVPGANGSSGVLNITQNTTIDLSLAASGAWDAANSANGIYDPDKWAVVFNYSSVNIDAGATLTFTNHPSKAPVVWLVSGNVTIAGTVSLNGQSSRTPPALSEPGPGGFRGGSGYYGVGVADGAGFGPKGGFRVARGGSYGGDLSYGNPSLIPLIGGSGGSGSTDQSARGGGAGGGAILIACSGIVTLDGSVTSVGGAGGDYYFGRLSGAGSGGGIRVVCSELVGTGNIRALGGNGGYNLAATFGRIRIERVSSLGAFTISPDPSVVPLTTGASALLWPPSTAPQVRVVSIGGVAAPTDPRAAFGASGADVALPETTTTAVLIETTNVEQASTVEVRLTPRSNSNPIVVNAAVSSVVSTSPLVVQWTADVPVSKGYAAVQVRVVRP